AENSIINQVTFEGNSKVEDTVLTEALALRPREVYTPERVQTAAQLIRDIYRIRGYFAAQVKPQIIRRDQGRVDIVFEITEGSPNRVKKIGFVGNKRFSESELRSCILTKESKWWRFLASDDAFEPERIAYDQELLRQHYLESGYVDFRVKSVSSELSPDQ